LRPGPVEPWFVRSSRPRLTTRNPSPRYLGEIDTTEAAKRKLVIKLAAKYADSDELAQAFRDDVARRSEMMSPGCDASVAADFWHSIAERPHRRRYPGNIQVSRSALSAIR
jgi:hypothetical protein